MACVLLLSVAHAYPENAPHKIAHLNGDDYRRLAGELTAVCPDAWARLSVFYWESIATKAVSDEGWGDDEFARPTEARAWLLAKGWPVPDGGDVNEDGLLEAATSAAVCVQSALHEFDS